MFLGEASTFDYPKTESSQRSTLEILPGPASNKLIRDVHNDVRLMRQDLTTLSRRGSHAHRSGRFDKDEVVNRKTSQCKEPEKDKAPRICAG